MKTFVTLLATTGAIIVQTCVIGLNGLTILTIGLTLFLGLNVAEKISEKKDKPQISKS
jgi:hypothetical protein